MRSPRRTRLPLLALFPVGVVALVVAVPLAWGDHPVRWNAGAVVPEASASADESPAGPEPSATATRPSGGGGALRIEHPWREGLTQWGVHVYWEDDPSQSVDELREKARRDVRYLDSLHANAVALSFPFHTGKKTSTKLFAGDNTPTPERMAAVARVFEEAGLRVTLRPLLDEKSLGGMPNWRGNIAPSDRDAWFASYAKFLTPYARAAQKVKADTFTVGAELNSLEGDRRWKPLVASVEKDFKGDVGYDANYDHYVSGHVDMPVNHLGVDAYFPLKLSDDASVADLVKGWNRWLDKKATGPLPRIVLSEAGIAAMDGAYKAPGDFYVKRTLNTRVQARWYEAVCEVVKERRMRGVYWWSLNFDDDPFSKPADSVSRLSFFGRPATEAAIRSCFTPDHPTGASTAPTS
ncbi:hypothetical protein ABT160_45205 [Streptomyces sp. NPDC001941]|uniref:glycoside hydrolase family 113 n=1 Tax=Streptomyces sp. NPDC001941 TaxID=3154659 RepID=UPI0033222E7D